jgi:hypothetical protein
MNSNNNEDIQMNHYMHPQFEPDYLKKQYVNPNICTKHTPLSNFRYKSDNKPINTSFTDFDNGTKTWAVVSRERLIIHNYNGGDCVNVQKGFYNVPYTLDQSKIKNKKQSCNIKLLHC